VGTALCNIITWIYFLKLSICAPDGSSNPVHTDIKPDSWAQSHSMTLTDFCRYSYCLWPCCVPFKANEVNEKWQCSTTMWCFWNLRSKTSMSIAKRNINRNQQNVLHLNLLASKIFVSTTLKQAHWSSLYYIHNVYSCTYYDIIQNHVTVNVLRFRNQ
jgi:hypothetical protein